MAITQLFAGVGQILTEFVESELQTSLIGAPTAPARSAWTPRPAPTRPAGTRT